VRSRKLPAPLPVAGRGLSGLRPGTAPVSPRAAVQRSLFYGGNSDAAAVHLVNAGIPTAAVNIARRYSHSPVEMLDFGDAMGALRLLEAAARTFSAETDLSFLGSQRG